MTQKSFSQRGPESELRALRVAVKKEFLLLCRYPLRFSYFLFVTVFEIATYVVTARMFGGPNEGPLDVEVWTGNYASFVTIGEIVMLFFGHTVWQVGYFFRQEQEIGILEHNFVCPTRPMIMLLSKTIAFDLVYCIQMPLVLLLSWMFLGLEVTGNALIASVILSLAVAVTFGLGLLFSSLILLFKRIDNLILLYVSFMYLFSGFGYPLAVLPSSLRVVSYFFPLTWALNAIRGVLIFDHTLEEVWTDMTGLIVFAVAFITIGYFIFKAMLVHVKRRGGLGEY